MYGVIIKESKGNFIPYTYNHFPVSEHDRLTKLFRVEQLFTKAGNGEIDSHEFLTRLGYADPVFHMKDYIENHLTMDEGFYTFADSMKNRFHFALLSNDVADWSRYITEYYHLEPYFAVKVISADVRCRKPESKIYEITLQRLGIPPEDCIFIDNSTQNLYAAGHLGMNTILFNRDNEEYDGKKVYSFDELYQMIQEDDLCD